MAPELLLLLNAVVYVKSLDLRIDPLVLLDQGLVRGLSTTDGEYSAFLGIPYAQVDYTNPFGNALPAPIFENVFSASDDRTACPQTALSRNLELNEEGSLDCLTLNIFVPNAATTQKPVLIWIHGGGFEVGKGSTENAYGIVMHDIIFVTINYRLGPYGFMCLDVPSVTGNQGLKDQVLALRWVRENIVAFGGDPDNITIGGNEAGGTSVNYHLYSQNDKLFNKAIIQSFTAQTTGAFITRDVTVARRLAEHLGYTTNSTEEALTFLATISSEQVTAAISELGVYLRPCKELSFSGIKNFIETDPISITNENKIRNTPILVGITSKEFNSYPFNDAAYIANSFYEVLERGFDLDEIELINAASFVRHYYLGDDTIISAPNNIVESFQSDFFIGHALQREVSKLVNTQGAGPVFQYVFNYVTEDQRDEFEGAPHGAEMAYIFNVDFEEHNAEDKAIALKVNQLWTNFIKYGNPTPTTTDTTGLAWQAVINGTRPYLIIDSDMRIENRFQKESMTFWDLFYATYGRFSRHVRDCSKKRK